MHELAHLICHSSNKCWSRHKYQYANWCLRTQLYPFICSHKSTEASRPSFPVLFFPVEPAVALVPQIAVSDKMGKNKQFAYSARLEIVLFQSLQDQSKVTALFHLLCAMLNFFECFCCENPVKEILDVIKIQPQPTAKCHHVPFNKHQDVWISTIKMAMLAETTTK